MKKLIFILLTLCLLLSLLPMAALADNDETAEQPTGETTEETTEATTEEPTQTPAPDSSCGDYVNWYYDSGILLITGAGEMDDYEKGQEPWSAYKNQITTLRFEGSVTYIGTYSFYDYDKLIEVDFGNDLYEIGAYAFYDCDGLTEIYLPASFKVFGERCFSGASNLVAIHCEGRFPSFRESCLWDVYCKIYYPVNNPWSVTYIAQLEEAFHGRIEFLASDGSDPYTPEEVTEATTEATTVATTQATTEATTEASSQEPEATEDGPQDNVADSSADVETDPVETSEKAPEQEKKKSSGNGIWIAVVLIGAVLIFVNLGMLLFGGKRKKKGKYHSQY